MAELAKYKSIGRADAKRHAMLAAMADTSRPADWVPAWHPSAWAPVVVVGEGGAGWGGSACWLFESRAGSQVWDTERMSVSSLTGDVQRLRKSWHQRVRGRRACGPLTAAPRTADSAPTRRSGWPRCRAFVGYRGGPTVAEDCADVMGQKETQSRHEVWSKLRPLFNVKPS